MRAHVLLALHRILDVRFLIVFVILQVFVEFATQEQCTGAATTLGGRMFAQRRVSADYMPEEDFAAKNFSAW